jgi:hypothetical protein
MEYPGEGVWAAAAEQGQLAYSGLPALRSRQAQEGQQFQFFRAASQPPGKLIRSNPLTLAIRLQVAMAATLRFIGVH